MMETMDAVELEKQRHNNTRMEALQLLAKLEVLHPFLEGWITYYLDSVINFSIVSYDELNDSYFIEVLAMPLLRVNLWFLMINAGCRLQMLILREPLLLHRRNLKWRYDVILILCWVANPSLSLSC